MVERTLSQRRIDQSYVSKLMEQMVRAESLAKPPGEEHIVHVTREGKRQCLVVNGQEGKYYDSIEELSPFLALMDRA